MIRRESAVVAVAGLALYAALCPPVSGMGDSSEFALVLATNGVAHPTGYPLYTLLGHGFVTLLHALGVPWSFAAGLWSAVGGALALYFLHALMVDLADEARGVGMGTRFLAALIPVSLFAFHPVVRGEATRAEVNVWSLAWACGAAFAFARLAAAIRSGAAASTPCARRGAVLWGSLVGAGLAHHLTSVLIAGPLTLALVALLARRRQLSAGLLPAAAAAGVLPVASYGFIAWRAWHPARVQWEWLEPSLAGVVAHISGEQYRLFIGAFAPSPFQRELLASAVYPFLFPGLALLLLGAMRAREVERRIEWLALLASAALVTIFTFRYGVPDPAPYFLPALALGVAGAAPAIVAIPRVGTRPGTAALGVVGAAGLFLIVPWLVDGREEGSATMAFDKVIRSMWSAIPADTAIVSWTDDRYTRLIEYQVLRGEKPALLIFTPDVLHAAKMRRRIRERFGVDPLEGFESPRLPIGAPDQEKAIIAESRRRLVRHLNDRVHVPVILFDPSVPIVWQLKKPWEPDQEPPRLLPSTRRWTHPPLGRAHP